VHQVPWSFTDLSGIGTVVEDDIGALLVDGLSNAEMPRASMLRSQK
jgi:hypothetical protein